MLSGDVAAEGDHSGSTLIKKIAYCRRCRLEDDTTSFCTTYENEIYESLIAHLLYDPEKFPTEYTHPEIKTLADEIEDLPEYPTKSSMYVDAEDKEYYKKKQFEEEEERQKLEYLLEQEFILDEKRVGKLQQSLQWRRGKRLTLVEQEGAEGVGGVGGHGIPSPPTESPGPPGPAVQASSGTAVQASSGTAE